MAPGIVDDGGGGRGEGRDALDAAGRRPDDHPVGAYLRLARRRPATSSSTGYHDLWRWSVDDLDGFWGALQRVVGRAVARDARSGAGSAAMPGGRWFPGGHAQLRRARAARGRRASPTRPRSSPHSQTRAPVALITWARAGRRRRPLSCRASCALGVRRGDRVVAYPPNIPETLVAFLAAASLGAVWSSCAPEFGTSRSSTASRRWSRRCCSPSTGTATARRTSTSATRSPRSRRRCRRSSTPCTSATSASGQDDLDRVARRVRAARVRPRCRSTTRSTCSTARAPPGCPRRSCTATAGSRSSTRRRCASTTTSARATGSRGSPPRAG